MAIVLVSGPAGPGYPLLPPDGGQAPVRGSNLDPAQEPAVTPQAARAEAEIAAPAASQRPAEASAESKKQDGAGREPGRQAQSDGQGDSLQIGLTPQEQGVVRRLQARDREVRTHEQAHMSAGGPHAGSATYSYETGPDGKRYAVGGEVPIDASKASSPEATMQKARTIRKAALAPASPSAADRQVAAKASAMELEARQELKEEKAEQAEAAAQDQAQKTASGDIDSPVPSRLPKAPPFPVRQNPLNKMV